MLTPIPDVGSKGTYKFAVPFSNIALPSDLYTCKAVRQISDYIANNEDVFSIAYKPYDLTTSDYQTDLTNNVFIISLQSQTGQWLFVPQQYITSYPIAEGIPYHNVMIGVGIGAIRTDNNLEAVRSAISALIQNSLGVTPDIKLVEISKTVLIDPDADARIQTALRAKSALALSDSAKYRQLLEAFNAQTTKLLALQNYIIANRDKLEI